MIGQTKLTVLPTGCFPMKFPYGLSDFSKLIREDYFYQDRSDRIPLLEQYGLAQNNAPRR